MISAVIFEANENALEHLKIILKEMRYINVCEYFVNENAFLKSLGKYKPNVAIIDMETSNVVRTDFLSDIEKISNEMDIIFVTAELIYFYYDYMKNGRTNFSLMLSKERETIGFHIEDGGEQNIYIRCFGSLGIYKDKSNTKESVIRWRTKKTKELFAYLLCQDGKNVSKEELIRVLFPEKEDGLNNLYVTMSFLKKQISDLNLKKKRNFN